MVPGRRQAGNASTKKRQSKESGQPKPKKKKKEEEQEEEIYRWSAAPAFAGVALPLRFMAPLCAGHRWDEEELPDGQKWRTLGAPTCPFARVGGRCLLHRRTGRTEHKGPFFPPPYEPLPSEVYLIYDGTPLPDRNRALGCGRCQPRAAQGNRCGCSRRPRKWPDSTP